MICECGMELIIGSLFTSLGHEIEYMECEKCGLVEISGFVKEMEDES